MSTEDVEHWLLSRKNALINRISLKPIEHSMRKGKPLSSKKGQAEAFFLVDDQGNWWILKKFHGNCKLDQRYLRKVSTLLPQTDGFLCGTNRHVLRQGTLLKTRGYHFSKDLDRWLDGTILMPRIGGLDWSGLAGDIRSGQIKLGPDHRLIICRNLTTLIGLLEGMQCCHRDLSCGNVFIEPQTLEVYLIDFDSLYHPSLSMPAVTTCGTAGYTAHHAWDQGQLDVKKTWCPHVDRYALSLLNTEFLMVEHQSDATGEGGLFDQEEIKHQKGIGLTRIIQQVQKTCPNAAQLLDATLHSTRFADCPSPEAWLQVINTQRGPVINPPSLQELAHIEFETLANKVQRQPVPLWPAPSLDQLPAQTPRIAKKTMVSIPHISLPPDPWRN
ncbi:hypothetical protein ACFL6U_12165 [Planctomycetota bacterium]